MNKTLEIYKFEELIGENAVADGYDYVLDENNRVIELNFYNHDYYEVWKDFNESFKYITMFPYLERLYVNVEGFNDIGPLSQLNQLTRIEIEYSGISDISPLRGHTNLKYINISGAEIVDVSPLSLLVNLEYLSIYDNKITDISTLANLTGLEKLYIGNNAITSVSALKNLTKLTGFAAEHNQLSEVTGIAENYGLTYLKLSKNAIEDVLFIGRFKEMETLYLDGNHIVDIQFISELKNLKHLYLGVNKITDIGVLRNLKNTLMTHLQVSSNQISDYSPIYHLEDLTYLEIGGNISKEINFVGRFTGLKHLDVSGVLGGNNDVLGDLTNLEILKISDNGLRDISFLPMFKTLYHLYLDNNDIEDMTYLKKYDFLNYLSVKNNAIKDGMPLLLIRNLKYVDLRGNVFGNAIFSTSTYGFRDGWGNLATLNYELADLSMEEGDYDKALALYLMPSDYYHPLQLPANIYEKLLEIYYHRFCETSVADSYYLKFYFVKCANILIRKEFDRDYRAIRDKIEFLCEKILQSNIEDRVGLVQRLEKGNAYYYFYEKEYKIYMDGPGEKKENPEAIFHIGASLTKNFNERGIAAYKKLQQLNHPLKDALYKAIVRNNFSQGNNWRIGEGSFGNKLDDETFVPYFNLKPDRETEKVQVDSAKSGGNAAKSTFWDRVVIFSVLIFVILAICVFLWILVLIIVEL